MLVHPNNSNGHGKGESYEGKDLNIIIRVWFVCLLSDPYLHAVFIAG